MGSWVLFLTHNFASPTELDKMHFTGRIQASGDDEVAEGDLHVGTGGRTNAPAVAAGSEAAPDPEPERLSVRGRRQRSEKDEEAEQVL